MASLRFKKDGTPFVDFYAHSKRHRPEFLSVKDAQKFYKLSEESPEEAFAMWQESLGSQSNLFSLKEKIESFKQDYCAKRANARDMKRIMTDFCEFVLARKRAEDVDIKSVNLEDLSAFQTKLVQSGIKNASVNRYFATIKTFFKRAQRAEYVTVNYASLVEGLEVEFTQREDVWQDGDTPKLVEHLINEEREQVLIDIARSMDFTPFGPTDFKRIKWQMVDLDRGVIRTYRMKGKGRREWNVPIVLGYHKLLLEIRRGQGGACPYVYAINGKPINPGWVSKVFERARKAVGIGSVPYTSRHRVITKVNDSSDLKTASKFAGHASTKTTERHYVVGREEEFQDKVKEAFAE